jgi:hypothetical protein
MPPPSEIKGLDPRFFRPCIFPLLTRWDYGTRVTLNNGIPADSPFAHEMSVSLSAYADGQCLGTTGAIARLAPGELCKPDATELVTAIPGAADRDDLLCIFHVTPVELVGTDAADIKAAEMMAHTRVSDDFIEYYQRPKGVVTGVAYQTGPLNDKRLSSTRTTVVQAPKVIVSDAVDTYFCLMNVSTDPSYDATVRMDFWILSPSGERITRSFVEVPAYTFRLVSARQALEAGGKLDEFVETGGLGMFLGYSKNGTVVPLSMTRNEQTGAIACDHTLPPPFYVTTWGGEKRLEANARLEQEFFADVPSDVPAVAL